MDELTNARVRDPVHAPDNHTPAQASLLVQLGTGVAIVLPLLGVIAAPFFVWGWGFGWVDLGLLLGMYVLTALGITVGFHRLFVHRSFDTFTWIKFIWAILGSMAAQGSLFHWVAVHRRHHQHSDKPTDPHTPHHHGRGILGLIRGLWHSHIGWLFSADPPDLAHYVKDLRASTTLWVASSLFLFWVALGILLPGLLGGLLTLTWGGVWTGMIWGGLVRLFLVHHVTWSVNSACHLWGRQPWASADESRDNWVFGILALGEGWHASHHAFPTSARHGLRWWQFDLSYWVIRMLSWVGLAWNVKLPTRESQEKKRRGAVPDFADAHLESPGP